MATTYRRELSRAIRLQRRSLRRLGRAHADRRRLQARGRLCAPHRHPPLASAQLRFSPRPQQQRVDPQVHLSGQPRLRHRRAGDRACRAGKRSDCSGSNSSPATSSRLEYSREYELLPARFAIAPGVIVPAGGYTYSTSRVSYSLGQQRQVSGPALSASTGTLYGGTKSDVSYSRTMGRDAAVLARAERDAGLGIAALRRLHGAACWVRGSR